MTIFAALLTYTFATLVLISVGMVIYALRLRRRVHKLARTIPTARQHNSPISQADAAQTPIMQYSEFKHRYGSRSRDIAIISGNGQAANVDCIQEFSDAMREHGTLLYHFTHYVSNGNNKSLQGKITSALREESFHAFFSVGLLATRMLKHATLNQNNKVPAVFAGVRDSWWHEEQEKRPINNMTGLISTSNWKRRIKLYLSIKPSMKAALIPATNPYLQADIDEVGSLLQQYGVTPHVIRIHDAPEMINVITHMSESIDSLICLQESLTPTIAAEVAAACMERKITYFTPFVADLHKGAAVAMTSSSGNIGMIAAQKMIHMLEDFKNPTDIPVTTVGSDLTYEVHLNQLAMRSQGLDPNLLIPLVMQQGASLHITEPIGS